MTRGLGLLQTHSTGCTGDSSAEARPPGGLAPSERRGRGPPTALPAPLAPPRPSCRRPPASAPAAAPRTPPPATRMLHPVLSQDTTEGAKRVMKRVWAGCMHMRGSGRLMPARARPESRSRAAALPRRRSRRPGPAARRWPAASAASGTLCTRKTFISCCPAAMLCRCQQRDRP